MSARRGGRGCSPARTWGIDLAGEKWAPSDLEEVARLHGLGRSDAEIATAVGRAIDAVSLVRRRRLGLVGWGPQQAKVEQPPSVKRPVSELFEALRGEHARKRDRHEAKRDLRAELPEPGPFALAIFGDAHVGDPGCDLSLLRECVDWARDTPHVYAVNVGDITNNWVGRLERLYAHQAITRDEEDEVGRWLIFALPWLVVVLGNHDEWEPKAKGWCREAGVAYASHGCRLRIEAPGSDPLYVDVRHDHPGRSQFDPAFGAKKLVYRGVPAEIVASGHIHQGASGVNPNGVAGTLSQTIRVGAFKHLDEYADAKGLTADSVGPLAVVVVDPDEPMYSPGRCTTFWDRGKAAMFLSALRGGRTLRRGTSPRPSS